MKKLVVFLIMAGLCSSLAAQPWRLTSPDGKIEVVISADRQITFAINRAGQPLLAPVAIDMEVAGYGSLAAKNRFVKARQTSTDRELQPVVPVKSAVIRDHYNELTLYFRKFQLVFRAYNNGVAYRFHTNFAKDIVVNNEVLQIASPQPATAWYPQEKDYSPAGNRHPEFLSHNERSYRHLPLDSIQPQHLASLPVLLEAGQHKILLAESDLRDYPGMWVRGRKQPGLQGVWPPYPAEVALAPGSDRTEQVLAYAGYLAQTAGRRAFPWRIFMVAAHDADLLTNQLVYQLAGACELTDTGWIEPGKVAWDWWNANNIYGVDFAAGINTATYKYYIDFAAHYSLEYVILDEGWYELGDLTKVVPEIDIPELVAYAKERNVGIILWVVWKTLDQQLTEALQQFDNWGIAGIKVDFMQRDDQQMVNYYEKIAREAARHHLLVDFHGAYKPAGLRRRFPNVLTREGVKGLEHNKWSTDITPTHNVTLPFIRMVPGPMDYTPGAMLNAQPEDFRIVFRRPMSMTTRAHQVAMYVVYESPLQMLADSPSNYLREPECTAFIADVPVVWDDIRVLVASVGNYVAVARKAGEVWYIGVMGNEQARTLELDLSFLGQGAFQLQYIADGPNAQRYAGDYVQQTKVVNRTTKLTVHLAPGGGWAGKITRQKAD